MFENGLGCLRRPAQKHYRCPSFWGGGREGEGGSERKCKEEERKGVNEEEIYTKNLLVYIYR